MAIRDKSRKPFIEDNDTNVKIGIDLPIRRDDGLDGFFAQTSTTIESVKNNIKNLLNTNLGEILMQPEIGMGLRNLLFEQMTEEKIITIQDQILDRFKIWLPFVEVRNIEIQTSDDNTNVDTNTMIVKILFNINKDPNTLVSLDVPFSEENVGGGY